MEPRIQYAKTSDGVSIAYATAGDGPPLVAMTIPPLSHVQGAWDAYGHILRPLAERFHVIWFDYRGTGLSDRDPVDFSMDAMVRDFEAVVERAGLTDFALFAVDAAVPIAVTYATVHPEKVSSLILTDGLIKYSDYYQNPGIVAEEALRSGDWTLLTETLARLWLGFDNQEMAATYAAYFRECVGPDAYRSAMSGMAKDDWDISDLLTRVSANTLVVHNRNNRFLPVQVGQRIAAGIPNARFQVMDDLGYVDLPEVVAAFLSVEATSNVVERAAPMESSVVTILFTDLASSTALTQRLGDAKAQELVRAHNTIVREALGAHGGTEIKHTGDGIMASFPTASGAIEAAIAIQRGVEETRAKGQGPSALAVHVGVNAGEPVAEESDLFGTSVQLAGRICDHAAAGQILVSNVVRELAAGKGFLFSDAGEVVPKGFEEPVRLYQVRWRE